MAAVRGTVVTSDEDCWINSLKKEVYQSGQDWESIEENMPACESSMKKELRHRRKFDEKMMQNLTQVKEFLVQVQATLNHALSMQDLLNDLDRKFEIKLENICQRHEFFQQQAVSHQKVLESIETLSVFNEPLLKVSRSCVQSVTAKLERVESKQILMSKRRKGISSAANTTTSIVEWLTVKINEHKMALNKMIEDVRMLIENQKATTLRYEKLVEDASIN